MRALVIYVDSSVVGGCEDAEFAADTLPLWERFVEGRHRLVLSEVTLRELLGAPQRVRDHVRRVPREHHGAGIRHPGDSHPEGGVGV